MATPAINELRLSMQQGDSLVVAIALVDSDDVAITLAGGTLRFGMAHSPNAGASLITKSSPASGIVIDDAPNGLATLTVLPADTASLPSGRYYYELQFDDAASQKTTFQYGRLDIRPQLITT